MIRLAPGLSGDYDSGTLYQVDADGQRVLVGLERPTIQRRSPA